MRIFEKYYVQIVAFIRRLQARVLRAKVGHTTTLNRRTRAILIIAFVCIMWWYFGVMRAPTAYPINELITIPRDEPLRTVASQLEEAHVVRSALWLEVIVRVYGGSTHIIAGDYLFKEPKNLLEVVHIIMSGTFGIEPMRIRILEGVNVNGMADIFADTLLRFDKEKFLLLATPLEGYLFPDTYFLMPTITEAEVIRTMYDNFSRRIAPLAADIAVSGHSLEDIVIMASIIQREAHNADDQKLISGALWNRIAIGMPLQVDATFVYTHGKGSYDITLAELRDEDNPYNTYVHKGLPPTPIASPGLSALTAAVNPTENDYLFYLADRRGVTHFSKTYEEHLQKKRLYID